LNGPACHQKIAAFWQSIFTFEIIINGLKTEQKWFWSGVERLLKIEH
jgi:hypothetical protein